MRIIAGRFRRRTIQAPKGMTTRPTTDRVREALFSILGNLDGLSVLDCYSGSGAIGLEALSRGARKVTLIETDAAALRTIAGNMKTLGVSESVRVVTTSVGRSRKELGALGPFDLVMSDPPWPIAAEAARDVARVLRGLLANDARVVLGHRSSEPLTLTPDSGLELVDQRHWGDSGLSFFRAVDSDGAGDPSA